MNDCGFHVLINECAILEKYNMEIIGFDDYLLGQTKTDFYHIQSNTFHLIVTHEPIISKFIEGFGDNFVLSGHTHGGQLFPMGIVQSLTSIPYFTKKLLPKGSDQFVKGFYTTQDIGTENSVQIYVSSGIGLTKYPFRLFNTPEIIEVNLIKK